MSEARRGPARMLPFAPLGTDISRVGLGSVRFRLGGKRQREAFEVLDAWSASGANLIDTAAVYGDGESERVLGSWLASSGARDQVILLTKGAHPGVPGWTSRMSPEAIEADLLGSLERLGTDAVDILMVHRDDPAATLRRPTPPVRRGSRCSSSHRRWWA